jgi:SAM-dependent methyltransferase
MSTPNPWTVVQSVDYEKHMGPDGADQLAPLSAVFQEAYLGAQPDRVLLLGCATGNGLEHVNPAVTQKVTGVDVNLQYLGIARQRFMHLGAKLELFCSEAEKFRAAPGSYDLVHAGLVFEYLHPEPLVRRIAEWIAPGGTCSVVLQLPGGEAPPPASKTLQIIEKAMKLVPPEELTRLFEHYGLARKRSKTVPLRHGKSFHVATYGRSA